MTHTMEKMIGRATMVMLLSAGLAAGAAVAQTDAAPPPPPPPDQTQGPPPQGTAGPRGAWRGGPEHRVEMLQKRLNLTDDQTAQVKAVFADSRSRMEALRDSSQGNSAPPDRHALREIHEQEEAKLEAILTPDQRAKYQQMREHQRERMEEHRQGPPPDGSAPPPPPPPAL
jgi:protein CpxP